MLPDTDETPVLNAFLARQAIFDRHKRVFGYELLFRSSASSDHFDGADYDQATSQVVANSYFAIGLERVLAGKNAFVNFTRSLLLSDFASVLPREASVIEILETVEPDAEVLAACRKLKQQGFRLALDDFACGRRYEPLAELADIIKVDIQAAREKDQEALMKQYGERGIKMLAEKVETLAEFERARNLGYVYFQGYFFARPVILAGREPPAFELHYLALLREILRPELEHLKIEEIVREEVSLAYKLLRYVNSARFSWRTTVDSIRHALALLGDRQIRQWASLAMVSHAGRDKPHELVVMTMVRARFCELLGAHVGLSGTESSHLFLLGIVSLLDAIMDVRLDQILRQLPVPEDIEETLLGGAGIGNRIARVYELERAWEAGDWDAVAERAGALGTRKDRLTELYVRSIQWAEEIFAS